MELELDSLKKYLITKIINPFKSKIRRFVLCKFHKGYVEAQLKKRRGDCLQCGKCCRFLYRCPFLIGSDENMRCLIYNFCRPSQCIAFPIDVKDLEEVNFKCGYYFYE